MTTTNEKFELLMERMKQQQSKKSASSKARSPHFIKWKVIMLQAIEKLELYPQFDITVLGHLKHLVRKLPEQLFIQAIINIKPLKPHFNTFISSTGPNSQMNDPILQNQSLKPEENSTNSSFKHSKILEKAASRRLTEQKNLLNSLIKNEQLLQQLSSPKHLFSQIIEGTVTILQSKYKNLMGKMIQVKGVVKIEKILDYLKKDIRMLQEFFKVSSQPFSDAFCTQGIKDEVFEKNICSFIVNFLRNHSQICQLLRKILKYAFKNSQQMKIFQERCPEQPDINRYDVPQSLKIQGCYVYTLHAIIQFSNAQNGKVSLQRLSQIRRAFYKDIDQYSKVNNHECERVNGQSQLQIMKFLLSKLKIFAGDIASQIKFIEVLYGDEEISFHFGQASYMHSQLAVAMEAIILGL